MENPDSTKIVYKSSYSPFDIIPALHPFEHQLMNINYHDITNHAKIILSDKNIYLYYKARLIQIEWPEDDCYIFDFHKATKPYSD